ncbi:TPA: hypothetical protein QC102_004767 [Bacillus cereus]|nr:hypothetical protein [Bacillus cereus]
MRRYLGILLCIMMFFGSFTGISFADETNQNEMKLEEEKQVEKKNMQASSNVQIAPSGKISNSLIEYAVGESGRFTIGTIAGDEGNPNDNNKPLMYGHPNPNTSYTTIRYNGQDIIFKPQKQWFEEETSSHVSEQKIDDLITINQYINIVKNNGTGKEDVVKIRYTAENIAPFNSEIGLRIMMDTMLGSNDAAPFRIPGKEEVTKELEMNGEALPSYWQAFDNLAEPSVIAQGTLENTLGEKPNKIQFANWRRLYDKSFDYSVDSSQPIGDSAVAIYWENQTVQSNSKKEFVTYYGLAQFDEDLRPPLAVRLGGETELEKVEEGYTTNPVSAVAYISNVGKAEAKNVKVKIKVTDGLKLHDDKTEEIEIGDVKVGETKQITWKLGAKLREKVRTETYSIVVKAQGLEDKQVNRDVVVPAEKPAVVFIPGIAGTELYDEKKDLVWEPDFYPFNDFAALDLNDDGTSKNEITTGEPLKEYYDEIINKLSKDNRVYVFGYDWRLDNTETQKKLREFIKKNDLEDFSIVAHSMGGLIASKYISQDDNKRNIKKLITLGTPYLGAPKGLWVLETGEFLSDWKDEVIKNHFKTISQKMISAYELLPHKQYFDEAYYAEKHEFRGWFTSDSKTKLKTYDDTKKLVLDGHLGGNSLQVEKTEGFYDFDLKDTLNSVDSYLIVGEGKPTIGKVNMLYFGNQAHGADIGGFIDGDGTVPISSADVGGIIDLNRIFYFDEEHSKLPKNKEVIELTLDILNNKKYQKRMDKIGDSPKTEMKWIKLQVESSIDLNVYDNQENRLGKREDRNSEKLIPFSYYYEIQGQKYAVLPMDQYRVELKGKEEGTITYTMEMYNKENFKNKTIRYESVPITKSTIIKTTTDETPKLLVDKNGDNQTDLEIFPTIILDEKQANDETSPDVSYQEINGIKGDGDWYISDVKVKVVASDMESGVQKIEYKIDNGEVASYQDGIEIKENGKHKLYSVAYNQNRIKSGATEKEIHIDKEKPNVLLQAEDRMVLGSKVTYQIDDKVSGIKIAQVLLNGKEVKEKEIFLTVAGENHIHIEATDQAGNKQIVDKSIMVQSPEDEVLSAVITPHLNQISGSKLKNTLLEVAIDVTNIKDNISIDMKSITLNKDQRPIIMTNRVYKDINGDGKKELLALFNIQNIEKYRVGNVIPINIEGKVDNKPFAGNAEIKIVN